MSDLHSGLELAPRCCESIELYCPKCSTLNYVDADDNVFIEEDIHYLVQCYKCEKVFKFETVRMVNYCVVDEDE